VLKLTYGNVELKKCFGGITPEPPFQGRDRRGREGRKGEGRGGGGMGDGLKPPPVTNSRYCQYFNYFYFYYERQGISVNTSISATITNYDYVIAIVLL